MGAPDEGHSNKQLAKEDSPTVSVSSCSCTLRCSSCSFSVAIVASLDMAWLNFCSSLTKATSGLMIGMRAPPPPPPFNSDDEPEAGQKLEQCAQKWGSGKLLP